MKYIYIILLAVLASACFGPKENKETAKAEPADSIKGYYGPCVEIDSIVHRFTVTRWSHALSDGNDGWQWDDWRPKDIEVLLSQDIFVGDEPAQMYHIKEEYPWNRMPNGHMMRTLIAVDQDGQDLEIMLEQVGDNHLCLYVAYDDEAFCYDMTENSKEVSE